MSPRVTNTGIQLIARRFDLAAVLAQFRRNVLQAERLIHFLFSITKGFAGGLDDGLVLVDRAERVFIEAEPLIERDLPHLDVVLQAAGEIIERRAPTRLRQNANIHLQAGEQFNRALGRSVTKDAGNVVHVYEALHDWSRIIAGDENVNITDCFASAADAAGQRAFLRFRQLQQAI